MVWKGQQAWETEQEWNLRYVAVTRAQEELVYVRQAGTAL
jgi:ATP-dependent exoDNAse (exonuclease V) beta subunit